MNIQQAYDELNNSLQTIYDKEEARLISISILEKITGHHRNRVFINEAEELTEAQLTDYNRYRAELLAHKPMQQVLNEAWFYEQQFFVNEHVLIPRPETEELLTVAFKELALFNDPDVLDVGTGSGIIPIVIKNKIPGAKITAVDISDEALQIAKRNAETHGADINFMKVDFIKDKDSIPGVYDLIISNPPYIAISEMGNMAKHVTEHEPHLALFVADENPLLFYHNIAMYATKHLRKFGRVLVEINEKYGEETASVFKNLGFEVVIVQDMSGKDRMVMGWFG